MTYPQPPIVPGPPPTATTPTPYATPYTTVYPAGPYGYPTLPGPTDSMVNTGSVLAILGGLVLGIGWIAPVDFYWAILGIGWFMFGPGVGIALLGLGRLRAR